MRRLVLLVISLLSLALAGPVSAACASDLSGRMASMVTAQDGSMSNSDCDMGKNKVQKCDHDACCGYQLAATAETGYVPASPPLRTPAVASLAKHLTGSGWEPLLDPPRA